MENLIELLRKRHIQTVHTGASFSFSITWSPERMNEIKELGESFSRLYDYTISVLPGSTVQLIGINLKRGR